MWTPLNSAVEREEKMTLQDFWKHLQAGGKTAQGWTYHVSADERLHINSPDARNCKFYITKDTVDSYFKKLRNGMDPRDFSYHHSAWFRRVYEHIVKWCVQKEHKHQQAITKRKQQLLVSDLGRWGCRKSQSRAKPLSWKKIQPLRMLCIRRSHAGEGSRDPRKLPLNHTEGVFLQAR